MGRAVKAGDRIDRSNDSGKILESLRRMVEQTRRHPVSLGTEGEALLAHLEHNLRTRPRVHYVALPGKPSDLMQPKVREVYKTLATEGPLTLPALEETLPDMDHNTLRFAIQVLRQAALVKSERP